jgi:hypothetical protein
MIKNEIVTLPSGKQMVRRVRMSVFGGRAVEGFYDKQLFLWSSPKSVHEYCILTPEDAAETLAAMNAFSAGAPND